MARKRKKPKMEYRYYQMPGDSPILALLGENGDRITGEMWIICIFTTIWRSASAMKEREQ